MSPSCVNQAFCQTCWLWLHLLPANDNSNSGVPWIRNYLQSGTEWSKPSPYTCKQSWNLYLIQLPSLLYIRTLKTQFSPTSVTMYEWAGASSMATGLTKQALLELKINIINARGAFKHILSQSEFCKTI